MYVHGIDCDRHWKARPTMTIDISTERKKELFARGFYDIDETNRCPSVSGSNI